MPITNMKQAEEGSDSLFQQYTIKEIQDIERKLRNDIEKKKEDLRQMVGERYQDLMSAADTITDMKISADKVTHHIKVMEQRCSNIYNQTTPSGLLQSSSLKVAKGLEPAENLFVIGAQIKILVDTPNMLWASMDSGDFLKVAQLFLLSLHITSNLNFDFSKGNNKMLKKFPILNNQIQTRKFRYTILRICRDSMKKDSLTDQELAGILCCLLLLDDVTPKTLFEEFLEMRLNSIDSVLRLDKEDSSTKDQACEVTGLICNTIQLIHSVFCQNESGKNLLLETYENVSSPSQESLINTDLSPVFSFLPDDVKNFKPQISQELPPILNNSMQKTCLKWLENVINLVQEKLKSLLQFVNSVKGLSSICNSLDDKLNEVYKNNWDEICICVFGKPFSPYSDMMKEIFIERIMLMWDSILETTFSHCEKCLNETLNTIMTDNWLDLERDLTKFIWVESPNDLSVQPGWLTSDLSDPNLENGILGMKSRGFTPEIKKLTGSLDESIKEHLDDIETFGTSTNGTIRESEMDSLRKHVKGSTKLRIGKFLSFTIAIPNDNFRKYAFVGRFCTALTELCSNLKKCFNTISTQVKDDEDWVIIKTEILNCGFKALSLWGVNLVSQELSILKTILQQCGATNMLESILTWDEQEISEETEDGKTVKSTIRLPMQASGFLQYTLFNICQSINQTVGHTLQRDIIKIFTQEILQDCFKYYKKASEQLHQQASDNPHFAQTYALQLLFDVQYLNGLFGSVHPTNRVQMEEVATTFETLIDPFDLDVFNPVLKVNLASALQRSVLLFGLLSIDRIGATSAQRLAVQNQPYNLLLANSGVGRFLLLPSNSKQEKHSPIEVVQKSPTQKMSRGYGSSPSLGQMAESDNVTKSYSFYDRFSAMGASWFKGNINN